MGRTLQIGAGGGLALAEAPGVYNLTMAPATLDAVTDAADADLMTLGVGGVAKKITFANLRIALGVTTTKQSNWDTAFGWGNHAGAGYISAESDPVFLASPAGGIEAGDIAAWDAKQAGDADLTALAALGSTGIAVRTASNTWAQRTLTGTANQVTVTNGSGAAGNPTISLPGVLHWPSAIASQVTLRNLQTSTLNKFFVQNTGGTSNIVALLESSGGDADFYLRNTSNANRVRLNANGDSYLTGGNVGLGLTTPENAFEVAETNNSDARPIVQIRQLGSGDASIRHRVAALSWTTGIDNSDSDAYKISESTALGSNDRVVVASGGNVGIGNAAPTVKLDVTGAGLFSGQVAAASIKVVPVSAAPTTAKGVIYYDSDDDHLYVWNGTTWKQLDNA